MPSNRHQRFVYNLVMAATLTLRDEKAPRLDDVSPAGAQKGPLSSLARTSGRNASNHNQNRPACNP
jgi:hypothetical protein